MDDIDDFSSLCRLCLVKNGVTNSIFDETSGLAQTFVKINVCLPVKVSRNDHLPKKICSSCSHKLDMLYTFRNTSLNSETQLLTWLQAARLQRREIRLTRESPEHDIETTSHNIENDEADVSPEKRKRFSDDTPIHYDTDDDETKTYFNTEEDCHQYVEASSTSVDDKFSGETSIVTIPDTVPEKSKQTYQAAYDRYKDWCALKKVERDTEKSLLAFFEEKSTDWKPSTLWATFSMVKATLSAHNGIDITNYATVTNFLKQNAKGYVAQRSKTFTRSEILRFLREAPEDRYLMMKVVLIIAVAGSCGFRELASLKIDDVIDTGVALIGNLPPRSSGGTARTFVVDNKSDGFLLNIYRKYKALRPPHTDHRRLFVYYRCGKCSKQVVGVHTLAKVPQEIARFLELEDVHLYTGHCFKRSSAKFLASSFSDMLELNTEDFAQTNRHEIFVKVETSN